MQRQRNERRSLGLRALRRIALAVLLLAAYATP
jgi:hypothetical protein